MRRLSSAPPRPTKRPRTGDCASRRSPSSGRSIRSGQASPALDLTLQVGLPGLLMLPGRLLVQFLIVGLFDLALQLLDRLLAGVLDEHGLLTLGLLERELGLLEVELLGDE